MPVTPSGKKMPYPKKGAASAKGKKGAMPFPPKTKAKAKGKKSK